MASVLTYDTAHFVFNVHNSLFCEYQYTAIIVRFSANVNIVIRILANVSVYKAAFWGLNRNINKETPSGCTSMA